MQTSKLIHRVYLPSNDHDQCNEQRCRCILSGRDSSGWLHRSLAAQSGMASTACDFCEYEQNMTSIFNETCVAKLDI